MRRIWLIVILFGVILGIFLVATNPSMEDFESFLQEEIHRKLHEEREESGDTLDASGSFLNFLEAAISAIVIEAMLAETQRKNYYLFSIYTIQLDDTVQLTYLGIAGQFFSLNEDFQLPEDSHREREK